MKTQDCNVMPDFNRDKRVRNNCRGSGFETNCQMGTCVAGNQDDGVPNSAINLNRPADHMDCVGRRVSDCKKVRKIIPPL